MRTLFVITCFANIAFAFGTLPWMPEKVEYSFYCDGRYGRFILDEDGRYVLRYKSVSLLTHAVLMNITIIGVGAIFWGLSLVPFTPITSYGTPNRNYWLKEENRPKIFRRARSYCESMGFGVMLVFLSIQWDIFSFNQVTSFHYHTVQDYATLIVIAFLIVETIRYVLFLRLPKGKEE